LPPPQEMLEMAGFGGAGGGSLHPVDVPKVGSNLPYQPPELIFNEIHKLSRNPGKIDFVTREKASDEFANDYDSKHRSYSQDYDDGEYFRGQERRRNSGRYVDREQTQQREQKEQREQLERRRSDDTQPNQLHYYSKEKPGSFLSLHEQPHQRDYMPATLNDAFGSQRSFFDNFDVRSEAESKASWPEKTGMQQSEIPVKSFEERSYNDYRRSKKAQLKSKDRARTLDWTSGEARAAVPLSHLEDGLSHHQRDYTDEPFSSLRSSTKKDNDQRGYIDYKRSKKAQLKQDDRARTLDWASGEDSADVPLNYLDDSKTYHEDYTDKPFLSLRSNPKDNGQRGYINDNLPPAAAPQPARFENFIDPQEMKARKKANSAMAPKGRREKTSILKAEFENFLPPFEDDHHSKSKIRIKLPKKAEKDVAKRPENRKKAVKVTKAKADERSWVEDKREKEKEPKEIPKESFFDGIARRSESFQRPPDMPRQVKLTFANLVAGGGGGSNDPRNKYKRINRFRTAANTNKKTEPKMSPNFEFYSGFLNMDPNTAPSHLLKRTGPAPEPVNPSLLNQFPEEPVDLLDRFTETERSGDNNQRMDAQHRSRTLNFREFLQPNQNHGKQHHQQHDHNLSPNDVNLHGNHYYEDKSPLPRPYHEAKEHRSLYSLYDPLAFKGRHLGPELPPPPETGFEPPPPPHVSLGKHVDHQAINDIEPMHQFVHVEDHYKFKAGHTRGSQGHYVKDIQERVGPRHKQVVSWHDSYGGHGKHYFEFNHGKVPISAMPAASENKATITRVETPAAVAAAAAGTPSQNRSASATVAAAAVR